MKENKMGTMPINKLLITMSLPMMISMLIQSLYNIVDSMFVAQINEQAITAVSLAFPLQNLMIAVSTGTGVGINALLSRSLGEKNREKASKTAENGILLGLVSSLVFVIFGFLGSRFFFEMQNCEQLVSEYGTQYLSICLIFSFGIFMQITFERLLQATGRTLHTMVTQSSGAIINMILDPILIFGLFGFPAMGVQGAAIATISGQIFAACLALIFNLKFNHDIDLSIRNITPDLPIIREIYAIGIPSIIMASIGSVMTFGMNQILLLFNQTAAAFFGIYIKLQSFVFMPIFGMNNGLVPIISYNYGAKQKSRILKTIKLGIFYATGIMLIGFALFQLIPDKLLMIFNASETMLSMGTVGLRIISLHFLFAGTCIVIGTTFQALGHGMYSLIVSIARQLAVLLPVAYLMALSGNLDLVWLAYPIAEVASLTISLYFFRKIYKKQIVPLESKA